MFRQKQLKYMYYSLTVGLFLTLK